MRRYQYRAFNLLVQSSAAPTFAEIMAHHLDQRLKLFSKVKFIQPDLIICSGDIGKSWSDYEQASKASTPEGEAPSKKAQALLRLYSHHDSSDDSDT